MKKLPLPSATLLMTVLLVASCATERNAGVLNALCSRSLDTRDALTMALDSPAIPDDADAIVEGARLIAQLDAACDDV